MPIAYDAEDLPAELLLHDAANAVIRRVTFVRDSSGRLLSDEFLFGEGAPFSELEKQSASPDPKGQARVATLFANVFGSTRAFSTTTYVYDEKGRVIQRSTRFGSLGEDRITTRYDEHDNPIEQTTECQEREVGTKPFNAPTSSAVRSVITLRITGDYHSLGRPVWGLE